MLKLTAAFLVATIVFWVLAFNVAAPPLAFVLACLGAVTLGLATGPFIYRRG